MPLLCLGAAIAVILVLNGVFYRTALGRAFRATSDDVEIAQLMGINNRSIYALTMAIALAVCAVAGSSSARAPVSIRASGRRGSSTPSRQSSSAGSAACGERSPAASSSASRRPSAPTSIRNGRSSAGHVAFLVVLVIRPRGLFPRAVD